MNPRRRLLVLFASAAGPELGFGHLVRCGVVARTLGARCELTLRGPEAARDAALRFGWTLHQGSSLLHHLQPDLLIVDDPSVIQRERWIGRARAAGVPVVVFVDGEARPGRADLVVDGSFAAVRRPRDGRCAGPDWALLSPAVGHRRRQPIARRRNRVLVALGGGAHVARLGVAAAAAITTHMPEVRVDLASGFAAGRRPSLPAGCRWIDTTNGLVDPLASCAVAVVAGGMTMYEACALGTPAVAVPVVAAQRPAIDAAASLGAVTRVTRGSGPARAGTIAAAVAHLLTRPDRASAQAATASRLVDGRGVARLVARIDRLLALHREGGRRAA